MRYRDYIPVKKYWLEMYATIFTAKHWKPVLKVPIKKIKVDKSMMSDPNEVSERDVLQMLLNFDKEAWNPIIVNKEYYLIDGQHRMELARQLGLNYIDVVIQDTDY